MSTLLGAGALLLVTALLTIALAVALLGGLAGMWRRRGQHGRLARAEGWRHAGSGRFEGRLGDSQWRGGANEDSDDGSRWTEFESGGASLFPGGFAIRSHAAWQRHHQRQAGAGGPVQRAVAGLDAALHRISFGLLDSDEHQGLDDPDRWAPCEVPGCDPDWSARWQMVASEPHWAAALTPQVQALWLKAAALHGGELQAQVHRRRFWLHRDDAAAPGLDQVAALLRLGQALLAASLAAGERRLPSPRPHEGA